MGLANDNPVGRPRDQLLAAGDTRSNVQPGLIAFHSLFVREHNRQCDEYLKKRPNASDDEVFEGARRIVIAELQAITFREFLPALFGREMPPYEGYNSSVQTDIGNAFATAAFRYGHSQVNTDLWRFDKDWNVIPEGHLPLRDAYFRPERVIREGGIDPLLRGFVYQPAQEVDTLMVDDMRNVLFPVAKREGLDLAAMNIQRGRDHGLPDYNSARGYLNLKKLSDFSEISDDPNVVKTLEELYDKNINNIDLWVGGLAENKVNGSELGLLFETLSLKNLLRVRDGDYYWYERNMTSQEQAEIHALTLSKIIQLNTDFKDVPKNVFFSSRECIDVADHQCVRKPERECSTMSPTSAVPTTDFSTSNATTMSMSPVSDSTTTEAATAQIPTTTAPTTEASSTAALLTTETPTTTSLPTAPSCCAQLQNCTADKRTLNSSLVEWERNSSLLLLDKVKLEKQLNAEKAASKKIQSDFLLLNISCQFTRAERDDLNQTVRIQMANISKLKDEVDRKEIIILQWQQSYNSTLTLLQRSQDLTAQNAKTCQRNITHLEKEKKLVKATLDDLQIQAANLNVSLFNATMKLLACRRSLVSTKAPGTTPATTQAAATTLSPTTASSTTTSPTTQRFVTTESPTSTEAGSTPPPCPTDDSALLSAMQTNISRLQQNLTSMASKAYSLQSQLQQSQNSNSYLRDENTKLQNSVSLGINQLKQCEYARDNAVDKWKACEARTPSPTSLPTTQFLRPPPTTTEKSAPCANVRQNASKAMEELQTKYDSVYKQLQQQLQQPSNETSPGRRNITFSDLSNSTLGLIVLAVAGGLFLLCLIFFILFLVFCIKYRRSNSDDTPKKYDFTVQNRAFNLGVSDKEYTSAEDAFDF